MTSLVDWRECVSFCFCGVRFLLPAPPIVLRHVTVVDTETGQLRRINPFWLKDGRSNGSAQRKPARARSEARRLSMREASSLFWIVGHARPLSRWKEADPGQRNVARALHRPRHHWRSPKWVATLPDACCSGAMKCAEAAWPRLLPAVRSSMAPSRHGPVDSCCQPGGSARAVETLQQMGAGFVKLVLFPRSERTPKRRS